MKIDQETVFRHRFWELINRGLSMGKRHFMLEGAIDDWFYNEYLGTQGLLSTLCIQLSLNRFLKVNRVLHLSGGDRGSQHNYLVTGYDRPSWSTSQGLDFPRAQFQHFEHALTGIRGGTTELLPGKPVEEHSSEGNTLNNPTSRTGNSAYRECLESLPILAGDATQNIAFVMSEFAASAGLYPTLGPDAGAYIQALDTIWRNDENLLTFLVIEDAAAIREHFFPKLEERVAVIPIGRPGIGEILRATRRREIDAISAHESYKILSTVLSNEKKTLKESLHLYAGIERDSFQDPSELRSMLMTNLDVCIDYQSWDDVVVSQQQKDDIRRLISHFQEAVSEKKSPSTCGILLHGPPGTGKTLLAKVIAAEEGMSFFSLTLSDAKAEFVGQTSAKIRRIFDEAAAAAPSVIFVDEIDGILPSRGDQRIADSFTRDAVNEFLPRLDGVGTSSNGVFLIGATNRLDLIDPAAISRLTQFEIPLPQEMQRIEIFQKELGLPKIDERSKDAHEWLLELAAKSEGLAGRDIQRLAGGIMSVIRQTLGERTDASHTRDFLNTVGREILDQLTEHGFRNSSNELKRKLSQTGRFVYISKQFELPTGILAEFQFGVHEFLRLRGMRSSFQQHHLAPVNRLLIKARPEQCSIRLIEHIAGRIGSDLFVLDDLTNISFAGIEELVSHLNQLSMTTSLLLHTPNALNDARQVSASLQYLLSNLAPSVTFVAFASQESTDSDSVFDQSVSIQRKLSQSEIEKWLVWIASRLQTKCCFEKGTISRISKAWSKSEGSIGLIAIERELNRALRTAVASGSFNDDHVKLISSHFGQMTFSF